MSRWDKPSGRWVVFREYFSGDWCVLRWNGPEPMRFRSWEDALSYANLRAGLGMLRARLRGEVAHAWDTGNGDGYIAYRWAHLRLNELLEGHRL